MLVGGDELAPSGEISFAAELLQAVQVDLADTSAGRWLWRLPPPTDASC
jgi:hypothetical protein